MQIQQVMCQCTGKTQDERNSCEDAASQQERIATPSAATLKQCEAILPTCQEFLSTPAGCAALTTVDGRRACGQAEATE